MKRPSTVSIDQFVEFLNSDWGDMYMDDIDDDVYNLHVDYVGEKAVAIAPGVKIKLREFDGVIGWQGVGEPPADMPETIVQFFFRWLDKQTHVTLSFSVPKELADKVQAAVKKILA